MMRRIRSVLEGLMRVHTASLVSVLLLVGMAAPCFGQAIRGEVFGKVYDPSGAILAGAELTATNLDNGAVSHAQSGADGTYTIPSLLPGRYKISAAKSGFATQELPSLNLLVDARSQVDFKLSLASAKTDVTVTAQASAVETGTAELGQVIEQKPITDLPLNGRDFLQLTLLSPGTSPLAGSSDVASFNSQSVNISGGRESSNQFTIDGVFDNAIHFEGLNLQPSIDAIQEFKIQRNTFNAEFGHGQAVVNLVTKSGGNQFHGTAYEFLRNDALDARQYFDTAKPPYRQNQFGGTFGGPLSHSTFFFVDYEGFRSRRSVTVLGSLPDSQMLAGNFSGLPAVIDPTTGMPFPNNQIPMNRFSAVTKRLLPFLPEIAGSGANNYVTAPSTKNDFDQFSVRLDHRFNDRDSIFGRFTRGTTDLYQPGLVPLTGLNVSDTPVNATIQWTHLFSPRLLNTALFGFNRNLQQRLQDGANDPNLNVLQFSNAVNSPVNYGFPLILLSGYSTFGTAITLPEIIGGNTFQYDDTIAWVHGRHTFKFGADIRNTQLPHTPYVASRGEFVFLGAVTGNPVADFLLGYPFISVGGGKGPSAYLSMKGTSFFAQDDFVVNRRLTLNLGIRYDRLSALSDRTRGRLGVFDPVRGVVVPPADVEKDGLVNPDNRDFGPRLGFAWQPFANGKTVVRGGYGIYYDQKPLNEYNFSLGTELSFQTLVGPNSWDTLFPAAAGSGVGILTDDPYAKTPRVQQYSLGMQQELPGRMTMELAYIGSNASRVNGRADLNQASLPTYPGEPLDQRRPYPNFGSIYAVNDSDYANYNSLQLSVQKNATRNLFFLAAYTYSKSLDIQSSTQDTVQNAHDLNAEYGLSDFNQKHRLSLSFNYLLPIGRGQSYASSVNGAVDKLIGGWQVNGIYTYSTGTPFTVGVFGVDRSDTGAFSGGLQRANLVGPNNGNIPGGGSVQEWFNTSAFVEAPMDTFGNSGRNIVIGPPINNLDFSLFKDTSVGERAVVEFRAEMFNVLNHSQFMNPVSDISNPAFGQIVASRDAREIQFGLKLRF